MYYFKHNWVAIMIFNQFAASMLILLHSINSSLYLFKFCNFIQSALSNTYLLLFLFRWSLLYGWLNILITIGKWSLLCRWSNIFHYLWCIISVDAIVMSIVECVLCVEECVWRLSLIIAKLLFLMSFAIFVCHWC